MYVLLFDLGLVAFVTHIGADLLIRQLDWPFLVVGTLTAAAFLWQWWVGRSAGLHVLVASALFIVLPDIADTLAKRRDLDARLYTTCIFHAAGGGE